MDSSSNDSFAWSRVSNSSDDSDSDPMSSHRETPLVNSDGDVSSSSKKIKKKKLKFEPPDSESSIDSPKKKKIKVEKSEEYVSKKKKKKKEKHDYNETIDNSEENVLGDFDYLNMIVKQEQDDYETATVLKAKKNKKSYSETDENNSLNENNTSLDDGEKKIKKVKNKPSNLEFESDNEKPASSPKKHKSKKNHNTTADQSDNLIIEDKFSAEETEVQKIPAHSISYDDEMTDDRITGSKDEATECIDKFENSLVLKEKKDKKKSVSGNNLSSTNSVHKQLNVTPRLLDRIRFEDETDSDTDKTKKTENNTIKESRHLKQFLKGKSSLQPVLEKLEICQAITDNDELWILKCPQELDVLDFNNKDLGLDSKSKVKVNGETFIGSLDEDLGRITVMTAANEEFIIKNVIVNGVVTLRKRLPKPHLVEDNVMVNNQTDFIPLPETKCRHPLFGSNYKTSLKVSSSIMQRLNDGNMSTSVTNDKKKKKKQVKEINGDLDANIDVKPKMEVNGPTKKAKKRKHNDDSERSIKKAKRIKQEPDMSDVWESEKAIEENLFNF